MEFSEVLQRLEVESGRGRGHVPADWLLRELQLAFIGPVAAQAECRLSSGGALATVVIGTYGAPRPSSLTWPMPAARATADDPDRAVPLPLLPGITPAFAEHIEMRWGEGYLHQTATLFDPTGRPIALNRQVVVVYDAP